MGAPEVLEKRARKNYFLNLKSGSTNMYKFITRSEWYKKNLEPVLSRFSWFEYQLLKRKSALHRWGWFLSRQKGASVDADGNAIPWYTYSFLDAFSGRIPSDLRVFEYGSGNSTRWWAERVKEVIAVEHDEGWYNSVVSNLPENATLLFRNLEDDAYPNAISESGKPFDLVIVDGRERVASVGGAVENLTKRGVIILDNSDRDKYHPAIELLKNKGFRQLKFTGFIPIDFVPSETSVFYRDHNCLGI